MLLKSSHKSLVQLSLRRNFSLGEVCYGRRPPKEEYQTSPFGMRNKSIDPINNRFRMTPKTAEPFNVRGGSIKWTKLPFLHRGVQRPGYYDPETKKFIFVEEMVPEVIVPKDLASCELKPYVSYNVDEITTPVFDAKQLFESTLERELISEYQSKQKQEKTE